MLFTALAAKALPLPYASTAFATKTVSFLAVLLRYDGGQVKITDFGLSKQVGCLSTTYITA